MLWSDRITSSPRDAELAVQQQEKTALLLLSDSSKAYRWRCCHHHPAATPPRQGSPIACKRECQAPRKEKHKKPALPGIAAKREASASLILEMELRHEAASLLRRHGGYRGGACEIYDASPGAVIRGLSVSSTLPTTAHHYTLS